MRKFIPTLILTISIAGSSSPLAAQNNPVPFVSNPTAPAAIAAGGQEFTLTVNGAGFVKGATVHWNGSPHATTFVSDTQLTASILASDLANPQQVFVTVLNPSPGGGVSNAVFFAVTTPITALAFTRSDSIFEISGLNAINKPTAMAVGYSSLDAAPALSVANSLCPAAVSCANDRATISMLAGGQVLEIFEPLSGSILMGDFNGDGILDMISIRPPNVSVSPGAPGNQFQARIDDPIPADVIYNVTPAMGDFNRDGHLDLVLAGISEFYFLPGNGDGTFGAPVSFGAGAPSGGGGLAVGDFNGDGILDIAATNEMANTVSIFLGNGDGTFKAPVNYPTGSFPLPIVAGDFNGDGKLDLAVLNGLDKNISILLGKGDGTFQAQVDYPAGISLAEIALGDFNGDGILDVAVSDTQCSSVACPAAGSVNILIGNGDGTFQRHLDFPAGGQPLPIASGEFNASTPTGRSGFAVGNYTDSTVSLYTPLQSPGGPTNPVPTISSISPTSITEGSGSFTLTVNGTNFVSGSTISFGGQTEPTTFVSSAQLTASIPGGAIAAAGPLSILVLTPSPGGGNSTSATFNVYLPPPMISSISPASAVAGSPGFTLTINGTNFVSGSLVNFNGAARSSVFVNSGQVTAIVTSSDVLNQGTISVSVTNPFGVNNSGGGTSSATTLTIVPNNTQPAIGALTPASATAGGPSFSLTISGAGFSPSSVVTFGSKPVTSAYQNPTEIQAAIPASAIAVPGTRLVTVSNPGSSPSLVVSFTVNPDFSLTSSNPSTTVTAGQTANFNLTLVAENGTLAGPVTFSASGLPAGTNPTFTPPSLPAGSAGTAVMLAITTTPHSAATSHAGPRGEWPAGPLCYALLFFGFPIMIALSLRSTFRSGAPRFTSQFLAVLLLSTAAGLIACGGGASYSASGPQPNPVTGTPTGTYTITANATSGGSAIQTKLVLTVN